MQILYPTVEEIAYAVKRAIDYRRDQARRRPEYCLFSEAALAELTQIMHQLNREPAPDRAAANAREVV